MNYIYGTWSALCALNVAGADASSPMIGRAVGWLASIQNPDGGWGEDGTSYRLDYRGHEPAPSTASQTAWALMGLMAAGAIDHPAVVRGIDYLLRNQGRDGFWAEEEYTATGFPRVFYLRYHGYAKFFPLWALSRYRNLRGRAASRIRHVIRATPRRLRSEAHGNALSAEAQPAGFLPADAMYLTRFGGSALSGRESSGSRFHTWVLPSSEMPR